MKDQELLDRLKAEIAGDGTIEDIIVVSNAIVDAGISARLAIDEATKAIKQVGEDFEKGDKYLPELMIAAKNMEKCLEILKPHLMVDDKSSSHGRVVIGTVSGDIHDLGKNLVATMLTLGGFEVTDVGINVAPFDFLSSAKDKRADIIALSSLMTTSLPYQEEVVNLLKETGSRDKYYIIVGGGPVTPEYASEIGADGYTEKASAAIKLCDNLMSSGKKPPMSTPLIV